VQDLFDYGWISIRGVNDKGNKFVATPNQNLQIFTNPLLNHNILFVKVAETMKNDVMNVEIYTKFLWGLLKFNLVRLELKSLLILLSHRETVINAPDGSLYIANIINDKPINGILIGLVYGENVITK
jgi:hypothetical protein